MGNVFYWDWEVSMIEWMQRSMGSAGEAVARVLSFLGGEVMMMAVLVLIAFCYKKEVGKRVALPLIVASMWFPMIKNIVLRVRPYIAHYESGKIKALQLTEADADPMSSALQGYSFPSGHAASSAALYGGFAWEIRKRWAIFISVILVLLIGVSRVAVGVHYPTDVLAGWGIGLLALGFSALLQKIRKEWLRYLVLLAVTVPGVFWCTSRDYFTALGMTIGLITVIPFERKYVNFKDTRNIWAMILRVAGGITGYFVLNKLLKLPFSEAFLDGGTLGANLIRTARYAVILFILLGVFPMAFPLFEKCGARMNQICGKLFGKKNQKT